MVDVILFFNDGIKIAFEFTGPSNFLLNFKFVHFNGKLFRMKQQKSKIYFSSFC